MKEILKYAAGVAGGVVCTIVTKKVVSIYSKKRVKKEKED